VRQALNLLVDRSAVQEQIYGRRARPARTSSTRPRATTPNHRWEFNVDKASQILDAAGWKRGADGVRAKDGKRLKFVFQTSINAPRQKTQAIVKQAAAKAGIEIELKSVVASVFFSSDPANPDTYPHFYSDIQMYNTTMTRRTRSLHEPVHLLGGRAEGQQVAGAQPHPVGSDEYDRAYQAADTETDPVKRAALFIKMNDIVISNVAVIPVLWRNGVSASTHGFAAWTSPAGTARSGACPTGTRGVAVGADLTPVIQGRRTRPPPLTVPSCSYKNGPSNSPAGHRDRPRRTTLQEEHANWMNASCAA
jgi:peptide/nickel transport system substrate-binding protein